LHLLGSNGLVTQSIDGIPLVRMDVAYPPKDEGLKDDKLGYFETNYLRIGLMSIQLIENTRLAHENVWVLDSFDGFGYLVLPA